MSKGNRKVSVVAMMAVLASLLLPVLAAPAQAAEPQNVGFTFQGCKLGTFQPATNTCLDGDYTGGNMGDGWNELDLVPFRVTAKAGKNAPATQTWTAGIVLDAIDGGKPGYDVISRPVLNTALSDPSCGPISSTGDGLIPDDGIELTPGIGGTDTSRYRLVTLTQDADTDCVFDFYGRLALGSHEYPGSSLHANLLNENLTVAGAGAHDRSIPVAALTPPSLNKSIEAFQDTDHTWTIDKDALPDEVDFGNVCDETFTGSLTTSITIQWTKGPAVGANTIQVHTLVEATNPAARVITIKVTDSLRSGTTEIESHNNGLLGVDVPAGAQGFDVLEYTTNVPAGTTNINDIATGTLIDKVTQIPIPGTITASASVSQIGSGTESNATASIQDIETFASAGGLTFSVADPGSGSFDGYTPNSVLGNGSSVTWNSGTLTDSGTVTFIKTIYYDGTGATTGDLDDTATLTTSGNVTSQASATVDVTTENSEATLTINKTTTAPADGDTTFTFLVEKIGGGFSDSVDVVVPDGTLASTTPGTLGGLGAGEYTITETGTGGYPSPATVPNVTITEGQCAAEITVDNTFGPASATAQKVTVPAGGEEGWTFKLYLDDDGTPGVSAGDSLIATDDTDATGLADFGQLTDEGDYYILEVGQPGYVSDGGVNCTFTVDYPADADVMFDKCTFTNTKLASAEVVKVTNPAGSEDGWTFKLFKDNAPDGAGAEDELLATVISTDANPTSFGVALGEGKYYVLETDGPTGFESDGGVNCVFTVAFPANAGQTFTCTFTNSAQGNIIVDKVTDPSGSDQAFEFDTSYGPNFNLKDADTPNDSGPLASGNYSVAEINIPSGWVLKSLTCVSSLGGNEAPAAIALTAGETVTCTATNEQQGKIRVAKTVNGANSAQTFTFELRQGAIDSDPGVGDDTPGVLKDTQIITANNTFVQLNGDLAPGVYQVCELLPSAGWSTNLGPNQFTLTLGGDNSRVCIDVDVSAGEAVDLQVDNTPPPGGNQLTIGFWKNHASCKTSGGNQSAVLDQVLATFPIAAGQTTHGFFVGDLYVDTCQEAVRLLNKTPVSGTNKKTANDPAFNLAAQLVAARLNVQAGAALCPLAQTAITDAQALLDTINFLGVVPPTMTAAQKAQANSLANTLDQYNNGLLC